MVKDLEERLLGSGPLAWLAEELQVVDTAGSDPTKWPTLQTYPLQVSAHFVDWSPKIDRCEGDSREITS